MAIDTRFDAYTALVFPESAPDNWRDILNILHIRWVESPLHCFDLNRYGEKETPHWHIMILSDNIRPGVISDVLSSINGSKPQPVYDTRALLRYFCHSDAPNMHQYPINQVIFHGGFDIDSIFSLYSWRK